MHVTVCIVTRDRGKQIANTLKSLIQSDFVDWDAVIVDQSKDEDTSDIVSDIIGNDSRFRFIRSQSIGSSVARNIAIAEARGPFIAFTDDDCEVAATWLGYLESYLRTDDSVGLAYGTVLSGPHDKRCGFIPDCPIVQVTRITSPLLKWRDKGIGANMICRLNVLKAVGGFDEVLGSGGPLYSYLDGDLTYRILKAHYTVLNIPDAVVVHHGFRPWSTGRQMMRGVGIGVGATYMKHLRLGDVAAIPNFLIEWLRCISWRRLLLLQRRTGLGRFLGYGRGAIISFRYAIDRQRRVYISASSGRVPLAKHPSQNDKVTTDNSESTQSSRVAH